MQANPLAEITETMNEESKGHMEMSVKATRDKSGFLRNLATNVKGPSVSVVLIAWLAAVVIVSIYDKLTIALGLLSMFMVIYLLIMGNRPN
jgi:hypothetical protein